MQQSLKEYQLPEYFWKATVNTKNKALCYIEKTAIHHEKPSVQGTWDID